MSRMVYDVGRNVRRATSIDEYLSAPAGRYVAGRTFVHFFASPELCGLLLWGRPNEEDVRAMTRALDSELPERAPLHSSVVDARRIEDVDAAAFEALVEYFRPRTVRFGDNIVRHALVRPSGVLGAVVAGFWGVVPATHPERTRVFTEMPEALGWVGAGDGLLAELEELHAAASGTPRPVQALRDHLATSPRRPTLAEVARRLSVSPRTFQEQLRAAGTTFRDELNVARVRAAEALLLTTDRSLTAIALEVGCASLQHFSTLFRKVTGESPSAWRARRASS
jgi:AraC-like DNA-binding protein